MPGPIAELETAGAKSARVGDEEMPDRMRWIRIYQASDAAAIREHAQRVGMPGEECYPVVTTVVRPDPVPAPAVA